MPSLSKVAAITGAVVGLAACATTGPSRPDPALAPVELRDDLNTALNEICFESDASSLEGLATSAGWVEIVNPIVVAFGQRSYLPDERAWQSPASGVVVFNQVLGGDICTVSVFGEHASVAAEIGAERIHARPERYVQNQGLVMSGQEDWIPSSEARTYVFDSQETGGPPIGIYTTGSEAFGLVTSITVPMSLQRSPANG